MNAPCIAPRPAVTSRRRLILALLGASAAAVATPAAATWPDKPVTIVVPVPAGGSGDLLARLVAQRLQARLGQPFVLDFRPGGSSLIGTEAVVRAKPDGYTVLLAISSLVSIPATSPKNLRFDPAKDLLPVTLAVKLPLIVVARPDAPFSSLREMVAYAKARPGQLSVAVSPGLGSGAHLALERLKLEGGFRAVAIPYRGTAPTMQALLGGEIPVAIDSIAGAAPFIADGRLKPLAIMTDRRSTGLPAIPTVAEIGFPGFEADTWMGFMLPAGTPLDIQARLQADITAILAEPEVRAPLIKAGMEPAGRSADEFLRAVERGIEVQKRVVKEQGLTFD